MVRYSGQRAGNVLSALEIQKLVRSTEAICMCLVARAHIHTHARINWMRGKLRSHSCLFTFALLENHKWFCYILCVNSSRQPRHICDLTHFLFWRTAEVNTFFCCGCYRWISLHVYGFVEEKRTPHLIYSTLLNAEGIALQLCRSQSHMFYYHIFFSVRCLRSSSNMKNIMF